MPVRKSKQKIGPRRAAAGSPIDLDQYVPSFITSIANKWSRSSSALYRRKYDIGMVEWRLMALLAIEPWIQATRVDAVVGMDKAAVSRSVPILEERGLIQTRPNQVDSRRREMALTPAGRKLHDEIAALALSRQEKLLASLSGDERQALLVLLRRMLANLDDLDEDTGRVARSTRQGSTQSGQE
jgi:DNA-binding MarR family transcriptional regulator